MNIDAGAGEVRVGLLDPETEKPFAGFSCEDCDPLSGDHISAEVRWSGKEGLSGLTGKKVVIKVVMHNADLYALGQV